MLDYFTISVFLKTEITVGNIDGKTYYMINPTGDVNWFEAETECCRTGGKLGTITSQAQYNLLNGQKAAINTHCSSRNYWTGGRDPYHKSYIWKDTNQTVISYNGKPILRSEQDLNNC